MAQPLGFLAHFYNALGLSFLSSGLSLALASPQSLQHVRTSPELARPTRGIERSIQSSSGESIGAFSFTAEGVALHPRSGSEVLAPRLEDWLGSPDGRTLVGAGDPSGFELPAELDVLVLRDGKRVARLEDLAPETELAVGENGSVAVVGAAARDPGQPFAAFLDPEGALCFRQALPRGTLGRDPQIFGDQLLVRSHGIGEEGSGGAVLLVSSRGVQPLLDAPGALSLVGFPEARRALLLSRETLTWFDADTGRVLWQRQARLRPASRQAWDLWHSTSGDSLALVTADLRRRGESASRFALILMDPADGAELARVDWSAANPACEVNVRSSPEEIAVETRSSREVFRWSR